jgi:hypothetical protein
MIEAFSAMREVHKRIDLLRAALSLSLEPHADRTCREFLARLEQHRWSGPELNAFEVGLALEIDIFFYSLQDVLPEDFFADR